jgi:hypothetical protein
MAKKRIETVFAVEVKPHEDIYKRDLEQALFAESLRTADALPRDQWDREAGKFFERTFLTEHLKSLLGRLLVRLCGVEGKGISVAELRVAMGGGKTHSLLGALWTARAPKVATKYLKEVLKHYDIKEIPTVSVAAIDCTDLGAKGRDVEGIRIRTLWGEIAYRLGGLGTYQIVKEYDESLQAPPASLIEAILKKAGPALILIDELLNYVVAAKGQIVLKDKSTLEEQTGAFVHRLVRTLPGVPQTSVIVTLVASRYDIPTEPEEAERLLARYTKIFEAVDVVEEPVVRDEIFGVLRRRLFDKLPSDERIEQVVEGIRDYYGEHPALKPFRAAEYMKRMRAAYPLHPELIDILNERFASHYKFQKTRGFLRLLARVIRDVWEIRPPDLFAIQPGHVNLGSQKIRSEALVIYDNAFGNILPHEIDRARRVEQDLGGAYRDGRLAQAALSAIFLYSAPTSANPGATEDQVKGAVLRPGVDPSMIAEILQRLDESLHHLYDPKQAGRYLFRTKARLSRIIEENAANLLAERETMKNALKDSVEEIAGEGKTKLRVYVFPESSAKIDDEPRASLALMRPDFDMDQAEHLKFGTDLVVRKGGVNRTHGNAVFVLAPRPELIEQARVKVGRLVACDQINPADDVLDREQRAELKRLQEQYRAEAQDALLRAYVRLGRLAEGEKLDVETIRWEETPGCDKATTLAERLYLYLKSHNLVLEQLDPGYLRQRLGDRKMTVKEAIEAFTGKPGKSVPVDAEVVKSAIAEGLKVGGFATEGAELTEETSIAVGTEAEKLKAAEPEEEAAPERPQHRRLVLNTTPAMSYIVAQVLERLKGVQGMSVRLEVTAENGLPTAKEEETRELLKKFGITPIFE